MDIQHFINENRWCINNSTSLTKWYVIDFNASHSIRFDLFVAFIKANGIKMRFDNKTLPVIIHEQYFYWSENTNARFKSTVINRSLISDITNYVNVEQYDYLFTSVEDSMEESQISSMIGDLKGSVLDVGCGTGLLHQLRYIQDYTGIDSSPVMIKKFIEKYPNRKHEVSICKAENLAKTERTYDNVIALYSASYIESLETFTKLWNKKGTMFLMFYKNSYSPITHEKLNLNAPYKLRTIEELSDFFKTKVIEFNNYNIVKL